MDTSLKGYKKFERRSKWVLIFFSVSLIVIVLTATLIFGLLSSTRAFTGYHSLWSHTQNRAIIHLVSYAISGEYEEYRSFEHNLNIMDGIQNALYELNMDEIDHDIVQQNLAKSSLYIEEINRKITHLHFLRNFDRFREAFDMWEKYHRNSEDLRSLGFEIRDKIEQGDMDTFSIEQLLFLAQNMNVTLVEDQIDLLNTMENAASTVKIYSSLFLVLVTFGVFFVGTILVSNLRSNFHTLGKITRDRDRIANFPALNPNPVIVINEQQSIDFINKAGEDFLKNELHTKGQISPLDQLLSKSTALFESFEDSIIHETEVNGKYYLIYSYLMREQKLVHHYLIDNTERKKLEINLEHSLEEKTMLLAEVHHRVKNNLAIMIGLLEIEIMNAANQEMEQSLKRSITRLYSISSIHKQIYEYKSLSTIYFDMFLNSIAETIQNQWSDLPLLLKGDSTYKKIKININQAVPFSMLINEIISALHDWHAPNEDTGEVVIHTEIREMTIDMSIKNNLFKDVQFNEKLQSNILFNLFNDQLNARQYTNPEMKSLRLSFEIADVKGSSSSLPLNYNPNEITY